MELSHLSKKKSKTKKTVKKNTHPIDLELLKSSLFLSALFQLNTSKHDFLNLSPLWPYGFYGSVLRAAVVSDSLIYKPWDIIMWNAPSHRMSLKKKVQRRFWYKQSLRTLSSKSESVSSAIFNTKLLLKLKQYINNTFRKHECVCADRRRCYGYTDSRTWAEWVMWEKEQIWHKNFHCMSWRNGWIKPCFKGTNAVLERCD